MRANRSSIALCMVGLVIVCVAGWLGWRWYDSRYPTWDEEVQLSDGRVIVVTQKHEYYENYGTNQSWVTFSLPEMDGRQTWHSYLIPQRIDVYNGKVYMFGFPRGDRQYRHYNYPKYYMVAFSWNGTEFQRIPFLQVPEQLRQEENIYPCIPNAPRHKLTLARKSRQWCPPVGDKKQFGKQIHLQEYVDAATRYSRRDGGKPISD